MSLVRAGLPLLILLAVSFNSQATCIVKSQKMTLSPETLTNRNNHALGSVLKKSSFAVQLPPSPECDELIKFSADVPGGASKMKTPGVFSNQCKRRWNENDFGHFKWARNSLAFKIFCKHV